MAQYKVPQDVEADDKLLGPFTFRQFIYLLVAAGLIALAWALFQVFPALVIIPVPVILFFGALALPIKKDQPMETYFAALVSFYLKPRKRFWEPGQPESTIRITAPKKVEQSRTKDLSRDEATHRLSFLAEIVDSEGYSIKGASNGSIREDVYAEASAAPDMFEISEQSPVQLKSFVKDDATIRHENLVKQMRQAIEKNEAKKDLGEAPIISKFEPQIEPILFTPQSPTIVSPSAPQNPSQIPNTQPENPAIIKPVNNPIPPASDQNNPPVNQDIINLANDPDLSVETIAKEAKRLEAKRNSEVYISLH